MNLLTVSNPKIIKGQKVGYLTYILHLAPAKLSGYNTCPKASTGCAAACLNLSGQGGMFRPGETTNRVQVARIRKTRQFFESRTEFMALLMADIVTAIRRAENKGFVPCFRLNGTSDIAWEKYSVIRDGVKYSNIFAAFPDVQFYDYTAIPRRKVSDIPNYHLSFSAKENNDRDIIWAVNNGLNLVVVFDLNKKEPLPVEYLGRPVIDADTNDLRFLDPKGVVCGLHSKGAGKLKALARESGFARKVIPLSVA